MLSGGLLVVAAHPAGAHSFLVATDPAQGERLAGPPAAVVLEFSETPDPASLQVELRTADGERVDVAEPEVAGLDVRVPLGDLADAVYVVGWAATSAVDGHGSAGEFAFAVGDVSGDVPAARTGSSTSGWGVAATVLFFVGLALAAGALALRGVAGGHDAVPGVGIVRAGLLLTVAGAAVAFVASDTDAGSRWELLVAIELVAVALLLVGLRRGWAGPLLFSVAAAGVWAAGSHGAAEHGVLGWAVDFVHLAAGAVWVGSLVLVVVAGWQSRLQRRPWLPLVARYARLAIGLVAVLGLAGVVGAVQLVPSSSDLWGTSYGRLVVAKASLLVVALGAAAVGRWWGLNRNKTDGVRSLMTGEVTIVAVAVILAGLLANGAPPVPAASAEQLLGPPPMDGDIIRDAGLAGQLNVEVAANGTRLDVDVFGPSGPPAGTEVGVTVEQPDGSQVDLVPRPCGSGCFTQAFELQPGATTVRVSMSAPGWIGGYYEARLDWPPGPAAPERLAALVERMRQVPELTLIETTTSGPGSKVSPAQVTMSGERFVGGEPYAGANLDDVHLVGENVLVLYLPGEQIFATLELDSAGRLSKARLVSRGHEIRREFTYPPLPG